MLFRTPLRIASVLSFLHGAMHQFGMSQPPSTPAELAITQSMQSFQMDVLGSLRSYMDFYRGMGLFMTIMLIGLGAILWQLSGLDNQSRASIRPVLLSIALLFFLLTAASIKYFFIAPIVIESSIAALVLLAFTRSRTAA